MKTFKIFIVLYWLLDGDGYLFSEYKDSFLTKEDALLFANTLKYRGESMKIFLPNETIPDDSEDDYETSPFVQIMEKCFDFFNKQTNGTN